MKWGQERQNAPECDDGVTLAAFWSARARPPPDKGSKRVLRLIGGYDGERREPAGTFNKVARDERPRTDCTSIWSAQTGGRTRERRPEGETVDGRWQRQEGQASADKSEVMIEQQAGRSQAAGSRWQRTSPEFDRRVEAGLPRRNARTLLRILRWTSR